MLFRSTSSCAAPTFLLSESQSSKSVKITWEGTPEHTRYQVQYKKQDVSNSVEKTNQTQSNKVDINSQKQEQNKKIDLTTLSKIIEETKLLDKKLSFYGTAIQQRDEKNIFAYSNEVENILDEIFAQLNSMKKGF